MRLRGSGSVQVGNLMFVPWNLTVAMLCRYSTHSRRNTTLVAELGWLSRNRVRSKGMGRLARGR